MNKFRFSSLAVGFFASISICSAQSSDGIIANHEYVDLGLKSGTKWATYNVGATKSYQVGDFYSWGETKTKKSYLIEDYKWTKGEKDPYNGSTLFTKYNKEDGKLALDTKDDAVIAKWGKGWRLPTKEEILELAEACNWEIVDDYNHTGVKGALGTSKENGHTIFLPGGGRWMVEKPVKGKGLGTPYYWTSTHNPGKNNYGAGCGFSVSTNIKGVTELYWTGFDRRIGANCRAVTK